MVNKEGDKLSDYPYTKVDEDTVKKILEILESESSKWNAPVKVLKSKTSEPFRVLISAIISTRTKDEVTVESTERLFPLAKTPYELARLDVIEIEKAIYPCGFFRTKAKNIKETSRILFEEFNSRVPDNMEDLLRLPGVGRKVANIVLSRVYGQKAIAVDTHVHRISNRVGLVNTKTPEETELELTKVLPQEWQSRFNELMVAFGQVICRPIKPWCDECPISKYCPKIRVKR
ncbi:MAG: endonuclease III [Candidatus Hydrothermae bacterium]|nr:endonuclease III [Candidatus Hydrothermae bacterium]HOK22501.1 endonuclease III [Candidatus Hydrothermia bacterium]